MSQKEVILRVIPQQKDTNPRGDIFGGWLMAQLDLAGMLVGARQIKSSFATVAVKEMAFKHPIFAFDEVSIYGEITDIGHTSFTVMLRAMVKRAPDYSNEPLVVSTAHIVYATIVSPGEKNHTTLAG